MPDYQKTKVACYLGFVTQAISANFAPLLFLKFHNDYDISLGNIALISTFFFLTQLLVDLFCAKFVDRIGYRVCIVTSEICAAAGLVGLAFLPDLLPNPFTGIIISVIIYAVGSGLIEVLCSPIIEACPFKNKEATMSLLHSFYCWGAAPRRDSTRRAGGRPAAGPRPRSCPPYPRLRCSYFHPLDGDAAGGVVHPLDVDVDGVFQRQQVGEVLAPLCRHHSALIQIVVEPCRAQIVLRGDAV